MSQIEDFPVDADGHCYSLSDVVTGCLLGINEAMRPQAEPDVRRALAIAWSLCDILDEKGVDLDALPALGLPRPLVERLTRKAGILDRLQEAAEQEAVQKDCGGRLVDCLLRLQYALPAAPRCPRIDVKDMPLRPRLAARSSPERGQIEFSALDPGPAARRRLERVDIPTVSGGGEWALYAANLSFELAPSPQDVDWPAYDQDEAAQARACVERSFAEGVRRGFEAALRLLARLGLQPPATSPRLMMRNVLPPTPLTGGSAALPVAIETLRQAMKLDWPLCVVSGAMDRDYRILPIDAADAQDAQGKLAAVLEEGSYDRLVAVTSRDLQSPGLDAIVAETASLEEVAVRVWGEKYREKVRDAILVKMRNSSIALDWDKANIPKGDDVFVRTEKAERLAGMIGAAPGLAIWHVGGPARSGKTWMAYDVQKRLEATGDWAVQVVRVVADAVEPDDLIDDLKQFADLASNLGDEKANRLLIVDGLTYDKDLSNLSATIGAILNDLGAHLLIVRRSSISSNWDPPSGADMQAIFTADDLAAFIDALSVQYAALIARSGADPKVFRRDYAGILGGVAHHRGLTTDLFWLCEHARSGYDLKQYRDWLTAGVSLSESEAIKRLAYATLYGIDCEAELCASLSAQTRDKLQVRPSSDGLLRIAQPLAAQMILWDPDALVQNHHYLEQSRGAEAILPIILHAIAPPQGSGLTDKSTRARRLTAIAHRLGASWQTTLKLIFRGTRVQGEWRDSLLSGDHRDVFKKMLEIGFIEKPWDLAGLILALRGALRTRDRLRLMRNMIQHMATEAGVRNLEFSCQRLRVCYRVVDEHELDLHEGSRLSVFDARDGDEIQALHREIRLNWLDFHDKLKRRNVTSKVFSEEKDLFQRLRLFEAMFELHMAEMLEEANASFPDLRTGVHGLGARKFGYLSRLHELVFAASNYNQLVAEDGHLLEGFREHEEDVRRIAGDACNRAFVKDDFANLSEFADCACLMLRFNLLSLREDAKRLADIFDRLAKTSKAQDTLAALGRIHNQLPPAATHLIANSQLFRDASFLAEGGGATLTDVAHFLFAMQGWNILIIQKMLYSQGVSLAPNERLAASLARRIKDEGDLRNCGRILRAAGQLDKIVAADLGAGFAARFLAHLGKDWLTDQIRREIRSALIFYVVQGLAQIGHEWLPLLEGEIVAHLAESIADNRFHQWSASLCVFLLTNETAAPIFAASIVNGRTFAADDIRAGMENASSIDALEAYHTLGRMLPEVGRDFVRSAPLEDCAADLAQTLAAPRNGEQALRAIRAVAATYRQFDVEKAAAFLRQFDQENLRAALRAAPFGSAASALTILAELNRDETIKLVESKAGAEILRYKLNLALKTPEAAAQIIHACEKINEGMGAKLLGDQAPAYRKILLARLSGTQNPRSYATSANMLESAWSEVAEHSAVFNRVWASAVQHIRSPAVLVEILILFDKALKKERRKDSAARRQPSRGEVHRIAEAIEARKIVQRLSAHRLVEDLSFTPTLALLLHRLGEVEQAALLRDALFGIDDLETFLPEELAFDLVMLAEETGVKIPEALLRRIDRRFLDQGASGWQIHPLRFWRAFGAYGLARKLHLKHGWNAFDKPPPTLKVLLDPATRVLASAALTPSPWVAAHADAAWAEIRKTPDVVPWEMRRLIHALTGYRTETAEALKGLLPTGALFQINPFSVGCTQRLTTAAKRTVAYI